MANTGGCRVLTPSGTSTITITIDQEHSHFVVEWTSNQNQTIVISGTPLDGQALTMFIANDGVLPRVLSFSTGLRCGSGITGITSKMATVFCVAIDGTFVEVSRSENL